jgi:hypothetical protein
MSEVIGNKRVRLVRYDKKSKAVDNFSIESNMKIPNN